MFFLYESVSLMLGHIKRQRQKKTHTQFYHFKFVFFLVYTALVGLWALSNSGLWKKKK